MEDHFKGHFSNHFAHHKSHMGGGDFDFNSIFDEDLFGKSVSHTVRQNDLCTRAGN